MHQFTDGLAHLVVQEVETAHVGKPEDLEVGNDANEAKTLVNSGFQHVLE